MILGLIGIGVIAGGIAAAAALCLGAGVLAALGAYMLGGVAGMAAGAGLALIATPDCPPDAGEGLAGGYGPHGPGLGAGPQAA